MSLRSGHFRPALLLGGPSRGGGWGGGVWWEGSVQASEPASMKQSQQQTRHALLPE